MYYFYDHRKNEVGYYADLVDALHGEPRDIEHFNGLATEEEKIRFCEDVNINCYISKSKDDLLEIMQDMEISNFEELKQELLSL
jgi:hypothetical protein